MFDNIRGSSAAPSSYYSEANDQAPASSYAPSESRRSSYDQFGSLAPRSDAVSEFGSVVSQELLGDYYAPQYQNPTAYSHWSAGVRPRSDSSAGSYGSADNRSFQDRSSAGSDASSHLPPSPATTSTVSSLHPLSDIGQTLSEAGSRRSSGGHLSSHSSDWSLNSHQNRLPSVSDGSAQRSLTGAELDAIASARRGGRFFPGQSELGSVASGLGYDGGGFSRRGGTRGSGNGHSTAENLSDAGSGSVSPERAGYLERLNRLREGFSASPDLPSMAWQPDTLLSADEISLSTSVTAGPPSRRPPPPPSRLGRESYQPSNSSAATSAVGSSRPPRGRPAIYGKQPLLSRAWNAVKDRR
jgi:hypothetical protein